MELLSIIALIASVFAIITGIIKVYEFFFNKKNKRVGTEIKHSTKLRTLKEEINIKTNLPRKELFVGRETEKKEIIEAFNTILPIISITGIGGIGKSSIAREVCVDLLKNKIFEGIVWISAKDSQLDFEEVIDTILKASGLDHALKLPILRKRDQAMDVLGIKKVLIVLDSFEEFKQSKLLTSFIQKIPEKSKILITTRHIENIDSYQVPIGGFEKSDSLNFVYQHAKLIGLSLNTNNESILLELCKEIGFAPLAIKWSLGQIKQKGQSIEGILRWLKTANGEIFQSIFDHSWMILNDDCKLTLMASSVFAAPVTIEVYASVTQLNQNKLENSIARLVELSLLNPSDELNFSNKRYEIHPLTRLFAKSKLKDKIVTQQMLQSRGADYYLSYMKVNGGEKWDWDSFNSLDSEYENIENTIDWFYEQGNWSVIKEIRNYLTLFLSIRGHWTKRIDLANKVINACKETNDNTTMAWCLVYDLAYIDLKYQKFDSAKIKVEQGLKCFIDNNNLLGIATATRHLGKIAQMQKRYLEAETLFKKSYDIYISQDPEYGAFLLWDLGDLFFNQEQYELSKKYFKDSLAESENKIGKSEAVSAMSHGFLGEIAQMEKDEKLAFFHYSKELEISNRIGRSDEMALANKRLAFFMYYIKKDRFKAALYAKAAYSIYFQLADDAKINDLNLLLEKLEK